MQERLEEKNSELQMLKEEQQQRSPVEVKTDSGSNKRARSEETPIETDNLGTKT